MSAAPPVIRCPRDGSTDVTLLSSETGKATIRKLYRCNVDGENFVIWQEKMQGAIKKSQKT